MTTNGEIVTGTEIEIPLNKLKKSPRNARKVPHSDAAIEALAASIGAKKLLQKPVVEPERDDAGGLTGFWLVTIGEGRRLALRMLAARGQIKKAHLVPCVIDTEFDPQEISLDENVTRSAMHPADQFDAFRDLNERLGWGAEEIGGRFGVSAHVVRQRLRLATVSPRLMGVYREGGLTLDQLMAFAVSEDHERQEQVYEALSYNRSASFIWQAMTEAKVRAEDRRAVFVGVEAYAEAGGMVLRDLFTEDGGGWLEDVALLDRLVAEKLAAQAQALRDAEGWKWAEAHLDYPSGHGLARVYPVQIERGADDTEKIAAISAEYDALTEQWAAVEDLPQEVEARLAEIDAELDAFGDGYAYLPGDVARGGVFVVLAWDGSVRIERGFIRPEDMAPEPEVEAGEDAVSPEREGDGGAQAEDDEDGGAPLSDRLVAELTAYRSASLRDALAESPETALLCVVHALVLHTFCGAGTASCLDIRSASRALASEVQGVEDSPAGRRISERHDAWARQVPDQPALVWAFVTDLDTDSRMALLAHCVGLSLDAVQGWQRRSLALAHADALAGRLALDMRGDWQADARSYLGRVTKARILDAVAEAVGAEAAERLAGLKKAQMVEAAEGLLAGTGWLPRHLRTEDAAAHDGPDQEAAIAA